MVKTITVSKDNVLYVSSEVEVARFTDDTEYFNRNVLGDLLTQLQNILYVYDYIETFKVNQLQRWSDYTRSEVV